MPLILSLNFVFNYFELLSKLKISSFFPLIIFFWSFIFNYEVFYNTSEILNLNISQFLVRFDFTKFNFGHLDVACIFKWCLWVKVELQRTQLNFLLITHGFFTFENEQLLNKCDFKLRFRVKEALQLLQVNFFGNFGLTKSKFKPGHRFKMWTFRLLLRVNEALQLAQTNRSFTSLIFFIL